MKQDKNYKILVYIKEDNIMEPLCIDILHSTTLKDIIISINKNYNLNISYNYKIFTYCSENISEGTPLLNQEMSVINYNIYHNPPSSIIIVNPNFATEQNFPLLAIY